MSKTREGTHRPIHKHSIFFFSPADLLLEDKTHDLFSLTLDKVIVVCLRTYSTGIFQYAVVPTTSSPSSGTVSGSVINLKYICLKKKQLLKTFFFLRIRF